MKSIIEQASSIMKAIEKAWNQAEQPKEFSIKIFEKEERNFFGLTSKPAKIGIFFGDKPIIHEKPTSKPRPEIKECRPSYTKTSSFAPTSPKGSEGHGKDTEDRSTDTPSFTENPKDRSYSIETTKDRPTDKEKLASQSTSYSAKDTAKPQQQAAQQERRQQPTRPTAQPKSVQPRAAKTTPEKKQLTNDSSSFAPTSPSFDPSVAKASEGRRAFTSELAESIRTTGEGHSRATADKPRRVPATWNDAMITSTRDWLKRTLDLMHMKSIEFSSEVSGKNLKLTFNAPLIADAIHEKQLFRSLAHLIMSSLRNQYKQEIRDLKVILISHPTARAE